MKGESDERNAENHSCRTSINTLILNATWNNGITSFPRIDCAPSLLLSHHESMRVQPRATAVLTAFLLSMSSSNLSADAFAAAVPGSGGPSSLSASSAADSVPSHAREASNGEQEQQEQTEIPLLPATNNDDPSIPRIQLGESISFDHMGPIIINSDGTTRTIENWNEMSPQEQQTAWRRIAKRNEERRKALLIKEQQQDDLAKVSATDEL
jgi:hypothetical protein